MGYLVIAKESEKFDSSQKLRVVGCHSNQADADYHVQMVTEEYNKLTNLRGSWGNGHGEGSDRMVMDEDRDFSKFTKYVVIKIPTFTSGSYLKSVDDARLFDENMKRYLNQGEM